MKLKIIIKRAILYLLLIIAAFLLQTVVFPSLRFLYSVPNFLLIITFSYGFIYGSGLGIFCGVTAGLLMDLFYSELFGMFTLIYASLGFMSGFFHEAYHNDAIALPMILCVVCELIYNACLLAYKYLLQGSMDPSFWFRSIFVPETFFSLLVTLFAYRILLHANRRLDSIDELRGRNVA